MVSSRLLEEIQMRLAAKERRADASSIPMEAVACDRGLPSSSTAQMRASYQKCLLLCGAWRSYLDPSWAAIGTCPVMIVIDLAELRDWHLIRLLVPDPMAAKWCSALGQERQLCMLDEWIIFPAVPEQMNEFSSYVVDTSNGLLGIIAVGP